MKIRILLSILLCGLITTVYAVDEGFYAGLQVGRSNLNNPRANVKVSPGVEVSSSPDNKGVAGRVLLGYNFDQYFALEGAYDYLGASNYTTATGPNPNLVENAFDFMGKGILQYQQFGLFGKLGIGLVNAAPGNSLAVSGHTSFVPVVAAGVTYDFTQHWVGDVTYTQFFSTSGIRAINTILVGISYHWVAEKCGQFLC